MIQLFNVSISFGAKEILNNINMSISAGARLALTGANGSGKTTLMRIISGDITPDSGNCVRSKGSTVSYLPQSGIRHENSTLYEEAEKSFNSLRLLIDEKERVGQMLEDMGKDDEKAINLAKRFSEVEERILSSGYYRREEKISSVLTGLGFKKDDFSKDTAVFSGGWQMRIALAKVLLEEAGIMLLDEPTNYLDLEARDWLEGFISRSRAGFLIVSHDRYFLDKTVSEVQELFLGTLKKYKGNYTQYESKRRQELEHLFKAYEAQQQEIEKTERFIAKFRSNASKASLVQSRIKYLEKLERIEIPEHMKRINFHFPPPPHSPKKVLSVDDLSKSYNGTSVFSGISAEIQKGEKTAVVGLNGAGKSTFLRLIAGREEPDGGKIRFGPGVRPAYFSQDEAEKLESSRRIIDEIEEAAPSELLTELRNMLGAFLFRGDDIYKPVNVLSGGEKSRIALLKILLHPSNLLILDEPTNHLDISSKEVLLDALLNFRGTVLFVAHDKYFLKQLACRVFEFKSNALTVYPGDYDYYLWKTEETGDAVIREKQDNGSSGRESEQKKSNEEQKLRRNRLQRLSREEEDIMKRLEEIDTEKKHCEQLLSKPEHYKNGESVKELGRSIEELNRERHRLDTRWEELETERLHLEKEG